MYHVGSGRGWRQDAVAMNGAMAGVVFATSATSMCVAVVDSTYAGQIWQPHCRMPSASRAQLRPAPRWCRDGAELASGLATFVMAAMHLPSTRISCKLEPWPMAAVVLYKAHGRATDEASPVSIDCSEPGPLGAG